jgi:RimJ/RimL family protein N-acetyltransferase
MNDAIWRARVPVLLTPRLRLRGHRQADLADSLAMWCAPEVVRYIGGRAFTEEEVWQRFLRYVGHWAVLGFGYWVIEDRATGRFVGEAGAGDARRALEPAWGPVMEVGWALHPWAHGHGRATEAVGAVLAWIDDQRAKGAAGVGAERRVVCMIEEGNTASERVAAKVGFSRYAVGRYQGDVVGLYERGRGGLGSRGERQPGPRSEGEVDEEPT